MHENEKELVEMTHYEKGDVVACTVVQVNDDEALVDIGWKSDGRIPLNELAAYKVEKASDAVSVGDKIDALILQINDDEGKVTLSKRQAEAVKAWDVLAEKYNKEETVEGIVREVVKGGIVLDLGVRAFMPASLVDIAYTETLDQYVGQSLRAKVIEFDKEKGKVVLSRKAILLEEQGKNKEEILKSVQEGEIRKGIVKRLTNFGAFVDIGGVDGLLHVSDMAWQRVKDPSEVVNIGEEVEVQILAVDRNKERISLGLKQIQKNPWEKASERYPMGALITGKVIRIAPFGAFVELEPGIDGLIHLSHLSEKRISKPEEVVSLGQEVTAKVLEVKEKEKRISLSLKDITLDAEKAQVEEYLKKQDEGSGVLLGDLFRDLFNKQNS